MINYIFVDRSIASVIRNGDFKVTGSHDSSPPISVDLSLLVTAAEKLHLSNTILYEIQRDSPTGNTNHCVINVTSELISMIECTIHGTDDYKRVLNTLNFFSK